MFPKAAKARRDPPPSGWAVDTLCASTHNRGKTPGSRGEQGLRQPRCRMAAPWGLLMGLAEPPCLRPSPADLPRGDSLGARWRSPPALAQAPWGAEAPQRWSPEALGLILSQYPQGNGARWEVALGLLYVGPWSQPVLMDHTGGALFMLKQTKALKEPVAK